MSGVPGTGLVRDWSGQGQKRQSSRFCMVVLRFAADSVFVTLRGCPVIFFSLSPRPELGHETLNEVEPRPTVAIPGNTPILDELRQRNLPIRTA